MIELQERTHAGQRPGYLGVALATLFLSVCLCLWEVSGRDMAWAHAFGNEHGFPWRDHWMFSEVLHEGGRRLSWAFALFLCLGVWWPVGVLRRIGLTHRLQLAATAMVASGVVAAIKSGSGSSCPWDMQAFGGVAHFVPHWRLWGLPDGGSGHCFPAGHASAGFAFAGGWFVFRAWPRVAAAWLGSAVGAGLVFGVAQQMRGAHFMSHTLWAGWICWVVAWAIDAVWPRVATEVLA